MNSSTPAKVASRSPPHIELLYASTLVADISDAPSPLAQKSSVPTDQNSRQMPSRKAKSPMRLTMNALRPA